MIVKIAEVYGETMEKKVMDTLPTLGLLLQQAESSKALKIIAQSRKINIPHPPVLKSLAKIILMCYVCSFLQFISKELNANFLKVHRLESHSASCPALNIGT